jgi:hypothetical protein
MGTWAESVVVGMFDEVAPSAHRSATHSHLCYHQARHCCSHPESPPDTPLARASRLLPRMHACAQCSRGCCTRGGVQAAHTLVSTFTAAEVAGTIRPYEDSFVASERASLSSIHTPLTPPLCNAPLLPLVDEAPPP